VLLDVQMPGLDGFETARLIRQRGRSRHIPIIFVTAYQQDDAEVLRGYSLGAVDFLFKPIIPEVLRAKTKVFVELRQRTEEVRLQADRLRELERQNFEQKLQQEREHWRAEALRQQMEEQRRINRDLEQADRQKNEFLAMLGHELRNPLAPVLIALELMRLQGLKDERLERARAAAERQVRHLTRLVDDLLDISRIERGKIELQRSARDMREVVSQAVETAQPFIDEKQHELVTELPNEPLVVHADSVRLVQVVGNLLHNAARYTESGGSLRVSLERSGGEAVVRVADSGQGIESALLEKVFDIFVQARRGGQGLGLGLTLVKRLVELHGGTVRAESAGKGLGSTFEVRVPLSDERPSIHPASIRPPARPLQVVLVEDDDDIRQSLQALLELLGHSVKSAADGPAGVDLICEAMPDIALLDVGLPGFDGLEVARQVKAKLAERSPVLIAVTGFGQVSDRERAQEAGFDDHLVKPASADDLRRALARAAGRDSPESGS
jgi:two-component system, sensor histidine kinase